MKLETNVGTFYIYFQHYHPNKRFGSKKYKRLISQSEMNLAKGRFLVYIQELNPKNPIPQPNRINGITECVINLRPGLYPITKNPTPNTPIRRSLLQRLEPLSDPQIGMSAASVDQFCRATGRLVALSRALRNFSAASRMEILNAYYKYIENGG